MHAGTKIDLRYVIRIAAAGLVSVCWLQPVVAGEAADPALDATEAAARASWSAAMAQNPASEEGCFHAAYPSFVWESVACAEGTPRVHPLPRTKAGEDVTGNGHDFVIGATGLITQTVGTFPTVTGVKSEKSVGVALFGGGGILGPNEYTLQANSNYTGTTSTCAGHSGCTVWQQFIYSTDYLSPGEAAVFMQYWLIGWGSSACPGGWMSAGGGDCYKNSAYTTAPDLKITGLGSMTLTGAAVAGGLDTVTFNSGTEAYSVTGKDSVVKLATVWKQTEFNVVGDAGGSRAVFNKGVTIKVKVAVKDGSTATPSCVANMGSTGETNNLDLGACSAAGGASPSISFTESD